MYTAVAGLRRDEADVLVRAPERLRRDRVGLLGAPREDLAQLIRGAAELPVPEPDGVEQLDDGLGDVLLERAVAGAVVARLDRLRRLAGRHGHDLDEVRDPRLVLGTDDVPPRVGDGRAKLAADDVGRVE